MKSVSSLLIVCQEKLFKAAPISKHNGYYRVIRYIKKNWAPNLSLRTSHIAKLLHLSESYIRKCISRLIKTDLIKVARKGFEYICLSTKVFHLTRSSNTAREYKKREIMIKSIRKQNAIEAYEWYKSNISVQKELSVQDFHTLLRKIADGKAKFYKEMGKILSGMEFYVAEKLRKDGIPLTEKAIYAAKWEHGWSDHYYDHLTDREKKVFHRQILHSAKGWYNLKDLTKMI